jgi:hypothetical protein
MEFNNAVVLLYGTKANAYTNHTSKLSTSKPLLFLPFLPLDPHLLRAQQQPPLRYKTKNKTINSRYSLVVTQPNY